MRFTVSTSLLIVTLMVTGCNPPVPPPAPAAQLNPAQASQQQVADAKAHVQQYVDRLLGGDQSIKTGLLGFEGVDFDTIESLTITSAVPTYLPDGTKVPDMVRVMLQVRGYDGLKKRMRDQQIVREVQFHQGRWSILGAGL